MIKFLVVDDSAFMRSMERIEILNTFKDAQILEATNGVEAVEAYKEHRPDIVLMDITMTEMQGTEAVKYIKQFDANCKVIMVSAMGQAVMVKEALLAGAKDFIVKPFDRDRFTEAIKKILK